MNINDITKIKDRQLIGSISSIEYIMKGIKNPPILPNVVIMPIDLALIKVGNNSDPYIMIDMKVIAANTLSNIIIIVLQLKKNPIGINDVINIKSIRNNLSNLTQSLIISSKINKPPVNSSI